MVFRLLLGPWETTVIILSSSAAEHAEFKKKMYSPDGMGSAIGIGAGCFIKVELHPSNHVIAKIDSRWIDGEAKKRSRDLGTLPEMANKNGDPTHDRTMRLPTPCTQHRRA